MKIELPGPSVRPAGPVGSRRMVPHPLRVAALVLASAISLATEACGGGVTPTEVTPSEQAADAGAEAACACTFDRGGHSVAMRCRDRGCFLVDGERVGARCTEQGLIDEADACVPRQATLIDGGAIPGRPGPTDAGVVPGEGTCTDEAAAVCSFTCPANAYCTCARGKPCELACGAELACVGAIDCAEASSCAIDCGGLSSCTSSRITCRGAGCALSCLGAGACNQSEIVCGDGPCEIDCDNGGCLEATIRCGKGPCTVRCGRRVNVGIECGESTACVDGCNE